LPAIKADSPKSSSVNGKQLVDDPLLQLCIRHGYTIQHGLKVKAGRWNNLSAFVASYEAFVEENRIALRVELLKLAFLANMRAARPGPLGFFFNRVALPDLEDLPVDLE
jgi:hypothetical protein